MIKISAFSYNTLSVNWEQEMKVSATVQGFVVSKGAPNSHYNTLAAWKVSEKASQEWIAENRQRSIGYVTIIAEVPGVHFLHLMITKLFK